MIDDNGFIVITPQHRRNIFQDIFIVGVLLDKYEYLSIYLLQHNMRIGYTYASKIIDFLVDAGTIIKSGINYVKAEDE